MANAKAKYEIALIDKTQKAFNKIGKSLKTLGKQTGMVSAAFAGFTLKTAGDFEASMNKVSAISGATGNTLQALEGQAKELGRTTSFSASQAADAMGFLSMAGFDAQQTMSAMPGILDLAAASNTDLAMTADIASNILSGLGMSADKTGRLADVMAKATASANLNVEELGEAMKMAAPMAESAGLSLEGMTAIMGKMADAGIKGTMAGTAVKAGITKLLNPTKQVSGVLDSMGVSVNNADGTMRNFIDILADLEQAGAGAADFVTIFGERAGPALLASTKSGTKSIVDLRSKLQGAGGTAQQMADTQLKGLNGSIKKLQSAFEGLQLAIADTGLLEWVTKLTDKLTAFIPKVLEFANEHPTFTKVGIALTAVGVALATLGGPITIVIGAIAGLTAAWIKWGDDIEAVWNGVVAKIQAIFHKVKMAFISPIKNMMEGVKKLMDKAPDWMVPDGLKAGIDGVLDEFRRMEDEAVGHSIIPDMVDKIGEVMGTLGDRMSDPARDAADSVNDSFKGMASSVSDSIQGMIKGTTSLKGALRNIGGGIAGKLQKKMWSPVDTMIDNWVDSLDFGGFFAKGGRPPVGRPSIVGERGAELFVPDSAGTIIPNDQLGGGQTVIVNYSPQVNALDPRTAQVVIAENAPTIVGVIRQAFNRNGRAVAI